MCVDAAAADEEVADDEKYPARRVQQRINVREGKDEILHAGDERLLILFPVLLKTFRRSLTLSRQRVEIVAALFQQAFRDESLDCVKDFAALVRVIASRLEQFV